MAMHKLCDYCGTDERDLGKKMLCLAEHDMPAVAYFCSRRHLSEWLALQPAYGPGGPIEGPS